MNKVKVAIMLLLMMFSMVGLTLQAQPAQRVIDVGDFNSLVLQDVVDVVAVQDSARAGQASFVASQRVADCLIFTNNGKGKLRIEVDEELLGKELAPVITVYSSHIKRVENDNNATLTVHGLGSVPKFVAVSTGNGFINIDQVDTPELELKSITGKGIITVATGSCAKLTARVVGGGTVDAAGVCATSARCNATGVGAIKCHVEGGSLNVRGNSKCSIYYTGNPSQVITHRLLGSVKLIKQD